MANEGTAAAPVEGADGLITPFEGAIPLPKGYVKGSLGSDPWGVYYDQVVDYNAAISKTKGKGKKAKPLYVEVQKEVDVAAPHQRGFDDLPGYGAQELAANTGNSSLGQFLQGSINARNNVLSNYLQQQDQARAGLQDYIPVREFTKMQGTGEFIPNPELKKAPPPLQVPIQPGAVQELPVYGGQELATYNPAMASSFRQRPTQK